ncbi:MAG: Eco57I restriction-modification methylase domain-containing protein, partial [Myxococcota bacterium]
MTTRSRALSPEAQRHADWLGMLQPEGLVVSIAVLEEQGVYVRQPPTVQEKLILLCPDEQLPSRETFFQLAEEVLDWPSAYCERRPEALQSWRLDLPDLGATLQPDAVLTDPKGSPLLFVCWCDGDPDLPHTDARWPASAQERLERLLTELQSTSAAPPAAAGASTLARRVPGPPIGVHVWRQGIRLTYAPSGEAPGSLTFPLEALSTVDGRILVDALVMLLGKSRLLTAPQPSRLRPILEQSRKRQEKVTTALASQVEEALAILVAGMDAAHQRSGHQLLRDMQDEAGRELLYRGLITLLLRLVFLFYAEDRHLLPMEHPVYANHYALSTLAERLQDDRLRHAQAMDRRFGAWARLLALFRLLYAGAHWPGVRDAQGLILRESLHIPAREGELFDPDAYPFLEGRPSGSRWTTDPTHMPPVDDGVVEAVLSRLIYLEGQRLSYRNLDVEQIGSVYESLMGFTLKRAEGTALALRPEGRVLDLAALQHADDPLRFLAKTTGLKPEELREKIPALAELALPTGVPPLSAPKAAQPKPLPLFAHLPPSSAAQGMPQPLSNPSASPERWSEEHWLRLLEPLQPRNGARYRPGEHYLQPGEERRKTGSHYTPRVLTERIVRRTLEPVLFGHAAGAARVPTAAHILSLKVCDPAMGSGAFLAEVCRYLSARLVEAWGREGNFPAETRGTDPLVVARRLVAENCLYGVDKNPFAVNLARLSLWLITLARDLPFTFVDHALKEGDSVMGLSLETLTSFYAEGASQLRLWKPAQVLEQAALDRAEILRRGDYRHKRRFLDDAEADVARERALGDLWLAHHWKGGKQKELKERLAWLMRDTQRWYSTHKPVAEMTSNLHTLRAELPMRPFHWALEFPEVFLRENPGFDAVVGNPPFITGRAIRGILGAGYPDLIATIRPHTHGNADLAAQFFLRAGELLRKEGCFGLVATNSIKQGDTRETGLQQLVQK